MSRLALVLLAFAVAACGSRPPATPSPTPVRTTETFSGTTVQSGVNTCGGDSHNVTAQEGDISVRLVATSDPNNALSIQVCAGGVDTAGNCAITQQRISVGQTLTGPRRGIAQQNVKPLPFACVFSNTFSPTPVTYTIEVTYMK